MEQLAVDKTGPKAFILAPNGEVSPYIPENDPIWALSLDASDTWPFYLHTTYQLRARLMRVFPNFIVGRHRLTKPADFALPPTVTSYTPSSIQIKSNFNNQLHIRFNCYLSEPGVLVGSIIVTHAGDEPITVNVELAAVLIPMDKGDPTHPETIDSNHFLSGQTDNINPLLFMCGGPVGTNNPYPALRLPLTLEPGQSEDIHWALASQATQEASLKAARSTVTQDWHRAFQSHIKSHEKNTVIITTGNPDWDNAFYLAQVNALTHLINLEAGGDQPTFTRTRLTDQPKRSREELAGYSDLTLLDALHLTQVLLPTHADHLAKLVEGFAARIDDQGHLPSQVYQGYTGTKVNECPLLANLFLALFEINHDPSFLNQAFPSLRRFADAGWMENTDRPDSLPNWETPAQLQLDTGMFNFDICEESGRGIDIRTAESPALAAMLYREALALKKISRILGDRSARIHYDKRAKIIQKKMLSLWDDEHDMFSYQDHDTHQSPTREIYYPGRIHKKLDINKNFTQPQRLQIHLTSQENHTRSGVVRLAGQNAAGNPIDELIQRPDLHWVGNQAYFTTRNVFFVLDTVEFEGFSLNDRFLVETADYSQADISCLLPVWAGGAHKEQISSMINSVLDRDDPDHTLGIPETWRIIHPLPEGMRSQVNILWNTLIIDGLAREGLIAEAMMLFTDLMSIIMRGLKDFNGFYPTYDFETSVPKGGANAITGLAPWGLFLKIAGIKLLSTDRVAIWGSNPFPWPIEVRWQGLYIRKEGEETQIIFPDGTHYQSQAVKPLVVKSARGKGQS